MVKKITHPTQNNKKVVSVVCYVQISHQCTRTGAGCSVPRRADWMDGGLRSCMSASHG